MDTVIKEPVATHGHSTSYHRNDLVIDSFWGDLDSQIFQDILMLLLAPMKPVKLHSYPVLISFFDFTLSVELLGGCFVKFSCR
jgi:hypothetical protein